MYQFRRNTGAKVFVLCTLAGVPVTGITSGGVTTYTSKNGGAASAVTLAGWVEMSAGNMPGVYAAQLQTTAFDTDGPVVFSFSSGTSAFDTYNVLGVVGDIDLLLDVRALAGQAGFKVASTTFDSFGNMLTGTITGYNPDADVDVATARVTLAVEATYDGSGRLSTMKVEEQ